MAIVAGLARGMTVLRIICAVRINRYLARTVILIVDLAEADHDFTRPEKPGFFIFSLSCDPSHQTERVIAVDHSV
jgi:hypothetical protein